MSTSQRDAAPLNFLSLDGGGVRGVSELVMLDRIMRRVQEIEGLPELPRPCDYFDLMAGTSTGGLIAILLGRLRMTTEEALETYDQVAKTVFGFSNRKLKAECQFRSSTLVDAVQDIVAQRNKGDLLIDSLASQRKGKAFVCASDTADLDVVQLFRTYDTVDGTDDWLKDCTVWEAARATTAAPTYFKPIEIKRGSVAKTFMDGAVSCNNPVEKLLEEAGCVFNSRRKIGAILSLGTGTKPKSMPKEAGTLGYIGSLVKMLKNQTVDTERAHLALKKKLENCPDTYFRFNVPDGGTVGLAEWDKMSALKKLTEDYMKQRTVAEEIEAVADVLAKKKTSGLTVSHVSCVTEDDPDLNTRTARSMGSVSRNFVGRRDILEKMDEFFEPRDVGARGRREFLLCGMGGAGKTQIALKFAKVAGERFKYIFWVDAENLQTARQSFRDIAITEMDQGINNDSSMEGVQNWIASLRDEWLLILDNSDAAYLQQVIPIGNRGNVIYTSRDHKLIQTLPEEAVAVVNDLELDDAITLLLKAAKILAYPLENREEARPVATELGCLALAVDQAGSYMFMQSCSPTEYLREFRARRAELMRDERYKGQDPRNQAVYATFDISFRAIKGLSTIQEGHFEGEDARNALKILELACFYHNEGIPEEMFERAAIDRCKKTSRGKPHPLVGGKVSLDSLLEVVEVESDKMWNAMPFRFGAMLLEQFSLVKRDRTRGNISMHVLIRSWAGDRMNPYYRIDRILCAKLIMSCAIPTTTTSEPWDAVFRRKLYPHAKAMQQYDDVMYAEDAIQSRVDMSFGHLAEEAGDYVEAERLYKRVIENRKLEVGPDHHSTLKAVTALADLCQKQARFPEAECLLLEVAESVEHTHGPDSQQSVNALWGLATTYVHQTRFEAAENAVLQVRERTMRLHKISNLNHEKLASANARLVEIRQFKAGIFETGTVDELQAKLDTCLRDHDKWDRRTLRARIQLGDALVSAGRPEEAEQHFFEAANGYANRHGPDHPRALDAFTQYAQLRIDQGQTPEAEYLLRDNLATTQRLRGERDIKAMHILFVLGKAIALQGRFDEGILLMEKAKDLQQALVGSEYLGVKFASEGIAAMVRMASNTTFAERRTRARRALATINPETAEQMTDFEIDRLCSFRHYTASFPQILDRPEMVYVTREERNARTRFPNLYEPAREPQTQTHQLELPIELLTMPSNGVMPLSEEFA
ncbi:Patatin-like protein 2 [Coniochaeta hoffmannii]|uniref:Patatin-like protein 2 n=1 Tax=Coniochaeta hoffmannii TaxID=91930 RepID=A0AA38RZ26_9PEZI|nr:Patatin-like protein 2 [Coniochaeta hoffmannii]